MHRVTLPALTAVLALFLVGCTGDDPGPAPSTTGTGATPTASSDVADGAVTREVEVSGAPVELTVHPLQVADGTALLTVDYAMRDDAPAGANVTLNMLLSSGAGISDVGGIRLVDLDGSKVWLSGNDAGAFPRVEPAVLMPGTTHRTESFFADPGVESVDVLFPFFGLVTDVPVVDAAPDATTPQDVGLTAGADYPTHTLDAFTVAFDDSATTSVEGSETTVTLASDVLFATDEFVLTPDAAARVDAAAAQIAQAAQAGEVRVVGHTDDAASDAYNLDLSQKRATSVAERLGAALGAGFTMATEGKGETEPIAAGASPEARAANRRVEIRFTATSPADALVGAGSTAPPPEPTGATGTGHDAVAVTVRDVTFDAAVESVVRRDGHLVGTILLTRTSAGGGGVDGVLGSAVTGRAAARGLSLYSTVAGANAATLLGEGMRVYPMDYVVVPAADGKPDQRAILADQFLKGRLEQGQSLAVTVVWPDTGQDTVSLDVPDVLRITDIPVED
ncbi:OmpA family protein [Cellulomonas dongxiuzhuiae]|uniref:OmpA family protein n=1 Tax=Cellulomonas dongxiuzhuiae TaxID=2819979 RepID=A0ABX8GGU1_9CELL|nr:OmpA family protein [Cellulomonas dongxiuzhuiae]MBO3088551.1 OmpA family protein [Cellulomonas dongxiuzhuiae]MBO3094116.1 OmpA family protein [Cellulomonas dongxiuzhuiae]QWC15180.1 OmpA family protein [Cellulomonas dongxiuzhuiae]